MTVTPTKPMIEHLSAPIELLAASDGEKAGRREFTCLAVPYGVEIDRVNWMLGTTKLRIDPGSMTFTDNPKLFFGHNWQLGEKPIGRVRATEETAAGPKATSVLAKTATADEVYALMQPDEDGVAVLDRVSVGFTILAYSVEGADTDNPVLVVTDAEVFELSVVPFPAYEGAEVESVLHDPSKGNRHMSDTITPPAPAGTDLFSKAEADALNTTIEALSGRVEQLGAQIATLGTSEPEGFDVPFASYGEYVKALAKGDDAAVNLFLAYEGGTIDDHGDVVKDGWLGDITKWLDKPRRVLNLFEKGSTPAEGMGVEYAYLDEDTTEVTEQLAEGDELAYGKVTFDTDRAPIKTYGGYGEASFQAIDRSPINIVETMFKAFTIRYAKRTEAVVRGAAINATGVKTVGSGIPDTADEWIDFTVDAATHLDDKGLTLEFMIVSADVFKALAKLRDGDNADAPRLLQRSSGGVDLTGLSADLYSVPVIPIAGTGIVRACNSFAVKSFENGGAPLRLGPEQDIKHLTKALGVYGYLAAAVQDAQAIVKPGA